VHARAPQVILDCSEDNQAFYAKCGFTRKEVQMALYL
jgi:glucosamine-phosphate N-acetyltransferase